MFFFDFQFIIFYQLALLVPDGLFFEHNFQHPLSVLFRHLFSSSHGKFFKVEFSLVVKVIDVGVLRLLKIDFFVPGSLLHLILLSFVSVLPFLIAVV